MVWTLYMSSEATNRRWQDRFDELVFASSPILLGLLMVYGKLTGWTVHPSLRFGGILELLYNPVGIAFVFVVGIVWLARVLR